MLAERTRGWIDQGKLEMLQRRFQLAGNLENQAEPQVDFIGTAIDRVNVQQLLERFDRPVEWQEEKTSWLFKKKNSLGCCQHSVLDDILNTHCVSEVVLQAGALVNRRKNENQD